jgi:hypothetical protein
MPEPDFDQIARRFAIDNGVTGITAAVAEQFRQVWNARGAADREAVSQESERIAIKDLDR